MNTEGSYGPNDDERIIMMYAMFREALKTYHALKIRRGHKEKTWSSWGKAGWSLNYNPF